MREAGRDVEYLELPGGHMEVPSHPEFLPTVERFLVDRMHPERSPPLAAMAASARSAHPRKGERLPPDRGGSRRVRSQAGEPVGDQTRTRPRPDQSLSVRVHDQPTEVAATLKIPIGTIGHSGRLRSAFLLSAGCAQRS